MKNNDPKNNLKNCAVYIFDLGFGFLFKEQALPFSLLKDIVTTILCVAMQ